jgi:hypothetical protein
MPRSKVSAFFSVLLVFVSGAAMGAVGYRLYAVKSVASGTNPSSPPKKSPEEFRKLIINNLKENVKLDDQQLAEVQRIYQEQHESFDQIHSKYQTQIDELPAVQQIHQDAKRDSDQIHDASVAKIKALLRPEQVPLYDKWQADRAADRKRHQQQQQHDHPDGKGRPPMPRPLPYPLP